MLKMVWLALALAVWAGPARSAEISANWPFQRLEAPRAPVPPAAIRSQTEWDAAMRQASKERGIIPARTRPVDWNRRMVISAPAFVSGIRAGEDSLTVYVIRHAALPPAGGVPYVVSVPATPLPVRFEDDPALRSGPCFIATATAESYVGVSKTVVLFPNAWRTDTHPETWRDIVYAPLTGPAMRRLANDLNRSGFDDLPAAGTDRPGWSGEGWKCRTVAIVDGKTKSASYHGANREGAPAALLRAVRAVFARGGSPGLPEQSPPRG